MEILLDEEGRTWVERPGTDGWRTYEVYDARGLLIGEMRTRAATGPSGRPYGASGTDTGARAIDRGDDRGAAR